MITEYDFFDGKWNKEDFMYVYSPISTVFDEFIQDKDGIRNTVSENPDYAHGEGYISIVTKKKFKRNVKLSALCSFETYGAPLIVISNDIRKNGDIARYGFHYEFVAYENGGNLWRIVPWPERTVRPIFPIKSAFVETPVAEGSKVLIEAVIRDTSFDISINGHSFRHETPEIPEEFHAGITVCEGVNKFYNFKIEEL